MCTINFDTWQHFCKSLSSKPFLKEKTSDETKYAASVIETFLMLGKMMSKCPVSVCCEIASAVASFYSADHSKEENLTLPEGIYYWLHSSMPVLIITAPELKGTRRTYNAVLIERSSVAKYIAEVQQSDIVSLHHHWILQSLQRYSDSRNACLPILNAILTLSTNGEHLSPIMCDGSLWLPQPPTVTTCCWWAWLHRYVVVSLCLVLKPCLLEWRSSGTYYSTDLSYRCVIYHYSILLVKMLLYTGCWTTQYFQVHKVILPPMSSLLHSLVSTFYRMLQKLFKSLMMTATSQQDKQLRNDMLMITSLIAALCPGAPFVVGIHILSYHYN